MNNIKNTRKVIIIGSGESASGFIPPVDATIIVVNGAEKRVPHFDYYFTLDPLIDAHNNVIRNNSIGSTVVAYNRPLGNVDIFYTRVADTSVNGIQGFTRTLAGKRTLSENKKEIHSGNSLYGALGFAYHLGFDKCVLVGLDAGGEKHLDYVTPRMDLNVEYAHLNELFKSTLPQVEGKVVNACLHSNVTCYPCMTIKDALVWLYE